MIAHLILKLRSNWIRREVSWFRTYGCYFSDWKWNYVFRIYVQEYVSVWWAGILPKQIREFVILKRDTWE